MLPESLREAKVGVGTLRITVQEAEALLSVSPSLTAMLGP
jgi:hypothetical protein